MVLKTVHSIIVRVSYCRDLNYHKSFKMMKIYILLVISFLPGVVDSNKTPGQSLDKTIQMLKKNLTSLAKQDQRIVTAVNQMVKDVKALKSMQPCSPCKVYQGSSNNMCDCTDLEPRQDCLAFYENGFKVNGVYRLTGPEFSHLTTYCDQTTMGGGWTVIQRRQDGSVDFTRKWNEYKNGFGKLTGEFWFGNDKIHDLTKSSNVSKKSELLINLRIKGQSKMVYSKYDIFEIGDEKSKYVLKIRGPSGNVSYADKMMYNNGMNFSTIDSDNDDWSQHCAVDSGRGGGWWYSRCSWVLLNSPYRSSGSYSIYWYYREVKPEFVEMKVRRSNRPIQS